MAGGDRNRVTIDIEEMLAKVQPVVTTECCIYRVPHEIRQVNQDAYTPKFVSIGPLHHGNKKLLGMESHKQIYCQYFITRSRASLDTLVRCVQELEPRVRSCYPESIKLGVDELVKVILVDCGFIIELFIRVLRITGDGVILLTPQSTQRISDDLLLLENQLPFFAFEKLYNLAFASLLIGNQYPPPFLRLAFCFFSDFIYIPEGLPPPASNTAHFTDLLRKVYLPPSNRRPSREREVLTLRYSASEFNKAGLKFTANPSSHSLLDFQFSGHTLKIPQIILKDSTEILLRNMVAFEHCHDPEESYITDYVQFLDSLIKTDKDVDVLVEHGIILSCLGDKKSVVELFNGPLKNIMVKSSSTNYLRIYKELNAYYEDPWHRHNYYNTLKRDYCNTPWKAVATIAGIALLILTVIQTVCSILQVVQRV